MPSSKLLVVLAGLLLALGVYSFWPPVGESGRVAVEGTLSVDGTPISTGSISFLPTQRTEGPSSSGRIENGQFHIGREAGPGVGEYRLIVQVGNTFAAQPHPRDQRETSPQEITAQRFERTVTTKAGGKNSFSFNFSASEVDDQAPSGQGSRVDSSTGRSPMR